MTSTVYPTSTTIWSGFSVRTLPVMAALSFNCMVSASAEGSPHATKAERKRHGLNITRHYSQRRALTSKQPGGWQRNLIYLYHLRPCGNLALHETHGVR